MEPNPQTTLYHIRAKRPIWVSRNGLRPGDRTAVRPDRRDDPHDRWLVLRVPIGGDHFGVGNRCEDARAWEDSLDAWLIPHPTAMWDGHEIGCGEFTLFLLTPSPDDLLQEFGPRGTPPPPGTRAFERQGRDGEERPLRLT